MSKNIEWLKKEVNELPLNFSGFSMLKQREEFTVNKDDVLELIDQLDEPEVLSQEWIEENKKDGSLHYIGYYVPIDSLHDLLVPKQETTYENAIKTIAEKIGTDEFSIGLYLEALHNNEKYEFLTEKWIEDNTSPVDEEGRLYVWKSDLLNVLVPKQEITEDQAWDKISEYYPVKAAGLKSAFEHFYYGGFMTDVVAKKPVIPQFVADWIEESHSFGSNLNHDIFNLITDAYDTDAGERKLIENYLYDNSDAIETIVDAYRYGYEVEEEQKYYVVDNEYIPLLQKGHGYVNRTSTGLSIFEKGRDNDQFALIEQEIKDYDERYWAFAKPVEELEE